ncbi:MAG: PQQ-binding-like beta-propeller repeat protein [Bacteroidota bacterium]|nr:PQQ-binding-like beta-propeller repeat protein [Bacteroidota bacterium]
MKKTGIYILFWLLFISVQGQKIHFAHITDTHVGGNTAAEDLERTIQDVNNLPDIDFVIFTGDITEFGSDEELLKAKAIISKLNKPWYIIPGNHDAKWSESGCNSFVRIFGSEEFAFEKNGYLFLGTASGPNMRMAPGLVPREQIVFMDSILTHMKNPSQPIIFVNHYPMDESLSNWYLVLDKLKTRNIQAILLGHGHINKLYNFEGIPAIMGRSNLRAHEECGGYNLVTISNDSISYEERTPAGPTHPAWCKMSIAQTKSVAESKSWSRPDYSVNNRYSQVTKVWEIQDKCDIGSGIVSNGKIAVYSNAAGAIVALDQMTGNVLWKYQTGGKIYSTPSIYKGRVICPSTDNRIYCLSLQTGKLKWVYATSKSIVASPVVHRGKVFVGASDGKFRALKVGNGAICWQYDSVMNFVETKPLIYKRAVYFGSWGDTFYALSEKDGKLLWKRQKYENRMLSPAAVWPVAAYNKIFLVAPDRRMTALDAKTGKEIWDSKKYSCRESIGISKDGELVYIKNMNEGNVDAFYTRSENQELAWESKAELGYDIAPSPIVEHNNLVFIPTDSGIVCAIDKKSHQIVWKHKLSNALVNCICPLENNRILVTTFDGIVSCLKF